MADGLEASSATGGTLSEWAGPYVTDMLGKAQALSTTPFTPYQGALTAGPSALQTQAFQGIGGLTLPGALDTASQQAQQTYGASQQYMPTVGTVESYMNPYLQAVLDPQIREAQRTAEQQRMETAGRLAKAGAYGGSRQAIMEAEGQRNLQTLLSDITGKGYANAFDTAQKQRLADIQAGQQGLAQQTAATQALTNIGANQAQYGLANLGKQLEAGQAQRGIEQEGLTADYNQFLRELGYDQQQLEFLRNMISGIPGVGSSTYYTQSPSALQSAAGGATTVANLLKILGQL